VTNGAAGAWDAYVASHPRATGYHAWAWRRVFERAFGHECVYLAAHDESGGITGVLPLVGFRSRLFGRFLVSLPFVNYGGVLASGDDARRALVAAAAGAAAERRCTHVELRHVNRECDDLAVKTHKVTMLLSLEGDAETAWKRLDNKVRNQVRKAEKSGLVAAAGGAELLPEFYPVFARNMRDLGTPVYSPRLFDEVFAQMPDRAAVFVVRKDTVTVAAGIGLTWRDTIEVPWASSLREYRQMCPNMMLYWAAIRHAVASGFRTFDFGRSTPNEGTFQFKKQWGAEPLPLHWEYWLGAGVAMPDQSPKNPKFSLAVRAWQRMPLWLANTLGPRIVRDIP
jgi:FemAB-related protein (PEP-CTERM system-associated)